MKCSHCINKAHPRKSLCQYHLEERQAQSGKELADILLLRSDTDNNKGKIRKGHEAYRYKTTYGSKTALGIYRTITRIIEEMKGLE